MPQQHTPLTPAPRSVVALTRLPRSNPAFASDQNWNIPYHAACRHRDSTNPILAMFWWQMPHHAVEGQINRFERPPSQPQETATNLSSRGR